MGKSFNWEQKTATIIKKNALTYHPNGLPATSTIEEGTEAYQTTQITKFNYENCD